VAGTTGKRWVSGTAALWLLTGAGCAIPDYHLPHGFSSTYYRHLQQGQPTILTAPGAWSGTPLPAAGMSRNYQGLDMIPPAPPALP
jgi:hypothetical protein